MKKVLISILVCVAIIGVAAVGTKFFGWKCSPLREYRVNTDRQIRETRDRIAEIEKENSRDMKNIERLRDQYSRLGTIYLQKSLWDMAIESFERSVKYGATPGVLYSLGIAHANRGVERDSMDDIDRAESYYKKALAMKDDLNDARNALAILLFYHKDEKDRALAMAEEVVARDKNFYIARFTLGRFYYEMNRPARALSVYEELYADLERLPPSDIINDYKNQCRENIQRIMSEMRRSKG
ncbi:MAG: tetratricopeptide repeat protein [Spirochaetes bacterium]|nr:tetratricopeptide repeat protein [Spirochaetota bacterium]